MKRVLIQSGHLNIRTNCDVALRGSTGAGGEVEINTAVRDALAVLLRDKDIEVKSVDANFNCNSTSADTDYDLFLALHCDMDYANDGGSGFCDFPEPSTDSATIESQRMAKVIQDSFFKEVGINVKSRSNANTRYYYMWKAISAKTPCVLIEMGQVKDTHDSVILNDTEKVAQALCNSILLALGMPVEAEMTCEEKLDEMRASRNSWKQKCSELEDKVELEREEHAVEVAAKQKIIDDQQILITTMQSDGISKDKRIKELGVIETTLRESLTATDKEITDLNISIGILTDELTKIKVSLKKMSLWDFIKIRYGK